MSINYQQIYDNLIKLGRSERTCVEFNKITGLWEVDEYRENHHIIPKCFFKEGNKRGLLLKNRDIPSNLVKLTGREHYIAHQLLTFIYAEEPDLIFAVHKMTAKNKNQTGRSKNKLYGWIKRKHAKKMSILNTGRKDSDETRQKKIKALTGRNVTNETRDLISNALKGIPKTKEHIEHIKIARANQIITKESTEKAIKSRQRNGWFKNPEQSSINMSKAQKGKIMPDPSIETCKTLSNALIGKPWSSKRRAAYEKNKNEGQIQKSRKNSTTKQKRNILCVETNEIFSSISEANKKYKGGIGECLRGFQRSAAGYHWQYI